MGVDEPLPWDYIFAEDAKEIQTVINKDSPMYSSVKDDEFYAILAMADSVMTFLVENRGIPFSSARDLRNKWLEETIKKSPQKQGRK
jgi:hypothetical protein